MAPKLLVAALIFVLPRLAPAMSCPPITVREAFDKADVVFRGTIVEVHDAQRDAISDILQPRKYIAVLRVTRIWKGGVGSTFEMPVKKISNAPAGYDWFWNNFLVVGNDLLVYAVRPEGSREFTTSHCARTHLAENSKDFQELGPGWEPTSAPSCTNGGRRKSGAVFQERGALLTNRCQTLASDRR